MNLIIINYEERALIVIRGSTRKERVKKLSYLKIIRNKFVRRIIHLNGSII